MRHKCPADLHKQWWHHGMWKLLTDTEKGSMKEEGDRYNNRQSAS
jgi:hypothetical protein